MDKKKQNEKQTFVRFEKCYSNFPKGEVQHGDKPDFIISGSRKIGVEITQMFHDNYKTRKGSRHKEIELYKEELLTDLVAILKDKKFHNCIIDISFINPNFNPKIRPKELAEKCVNDILKKFLFPPKNASITIDNIGQLPNIIASYEILISPSINDILYIETANAVGHTIDNEKIQVILNKKEKSIKEFEVCDEQWLVIKVSEFASDYFPEINVNCDNLHSTFSKIFILKYLESEIIELK